MAALFVQKNGIYYGIDDVDPWPESRDARKYRGPWPVVAHPPCARWCRLAGLVEARWGHKRGDDGGCFESALGSVREFGGVLEHPAYSDAWPAFGLPTPSYGGWQMGLCGGWVTQVDQFRYGHSAKKATYLYAFGVDDLPLLDWRTVTDNESTALVSWCGNNVKSGEKRPRVGKDNASRTPPHVSAPAARDRPVELQGHRERSATPVRFRNVMIEIAKSVNQRTQQVLTKGDKNDREGA